MLWWECCDTTQLPASSQPTGWSIPSLFPVRCRHWEEAWKKRGANVDWYPWKVLTFLIMYNGLSFSLFVATGTRLLAVSGQDSGIRLCLFETHKLKPGFMFSYNIILETVPSSLWILSSKVNEYCRYHINTTKNSFLWNLVNDCGSYLINNLHSAGHTVILWSKVIWWLKL